MLTETIRSLYSLYEYTDWANEKLFAAAAGIPVEATREVMPGHERSLSETLIHMLDAHRGWLSWWDGSAVTAEQREKLRYDRDVLTDIPAIEAAWSSVQWQTAAFLATLTDDVLAKNYDRELRDGRRFSQPLWAMMVHVANHGTQHRSEAAAMCTAASSSPGELDFVWFFSTR